MGKRLQKLWQIMAWNLYGKSRESCRSRFESHSSLELIENNERREKKILIIETPFLNGEVDNTPLMICGSPISRKIIIPLDILRPSSQRSNNLHFMLMLCDRYDSNIVQYYRKCSASKYMKDWLPFYVAYIKPTNTYYFSWSARKLHEWMVLIVDNNRYHKL